MRKVLMVLLLAVITVLTVSAQTVEVSVGKSVFTDEKTIDFSIRCASEQDLEITVFTNDFLALQQKSTLLPGETPFGIPSDSLPSGKYFILVTGNGLHVEKEFHVRH